MAFLIRNNSIFNGFIIPIQATSIAILGLAAVVDPGPKFPSPGEISLIVIINILIIIVVSVIVLGP